MNQEQTEMYHKLCDLNVSPVGSALSFEARLARENRYDLTYAIRVDREYRKFLFLMIYAGHPVTPSDQVDQAWHLHLIYTDSYWNVLCKEIASRSLHHGPTAGGLTEQAKYTDWYAKTKQSYQHFFEQEPPIDIWPDAKTRFGEDVHYQRVNLVRNLVLPRPSYCLRVLKNTIVTLFQKDKS